MIAYHDPVDHISKEIGKEKRKQNGGRRSNNGGRYYMSLCKFCGQELQTTIEDHVSVFYCTCAGMKKYVELCAELKELKLAVSEKEKEINTFVSQNSEYSRLLKEMEQKQKNLFKYEDCYNWHEY